MKILMALTMLLVGCDQVISNPDRDANQLYYVKDERTGLCFVYNSIGMSAQGGGGDVYTNVPCTTEVEKVIAEQHRGKATK